jgi:hypothetical protein
MNSRKFHDVEPMIDIMRKEINSGKKFEIETTQSKYKDTESIALTIVDNYDEIDQPGDKSHMSEEVSGTTPQSIPHLGWWGMSIILNFLTH